MLPSRPVVEVFCSYAPDDEQWLKELETHLGGLRQRGLISLWHNTLISAGTNRIEMINQRLEQASIILFLVSSNFLACDHCYQVEMMYALKRIENDETRRPRAIPIIVNPCTWEDTPLANLQYLPRNGEAISTWENREQAWNDVIRGIRNAIESLLQETIPDRQSQLSSPHVPTFQKQKSSSHSFLKLLLPLLLIISAVGGLWFWTTHNQVFQYHSYQKAPQSTAKTPMPSITPTSTTASSLSPETRLAMAKAALPVYKDTLNNPDNQNTATAAWDITAQCSFSPNGYQASTYQRKPAFCHERNNTYQDAFISVDMTIVNGASAGLLFRDQFSSNATGAYSFEVGSNGQYKISTVPYAVQSTLKNWTQSSATRTGQGVKNTLQVITQGNILFFYVNGSFLISIQDGKYKSGSISFACYTGSSSETEAIFSNLEIHKLS